MRQKNLRCLNQPETHVKVSKLTALNNISFFLVEKSSKFFMKQVSPYQLLSVVRDIVNVSSMLKVLPAVNANPCTGTWPRKTPRDVQVWLHGTFLLHMTCSHLYSLTLSVVLFVTFVTLVNSMFLILLNGNTKLPMIPFLLSETRP